MITSLELLNWRSHVSSSLEFSKGTNIIIGIMGSGKSSLMDALCFALFGNFPALQHRKLKLADVIKSRPGQEDSAEVKLGFTHNGSNYTVKRKLTVDGKTEAEIRKENKLIEGPQPKRVNEYITNLLSIDYDLFTRAIYSEQNNIDYFLELPRGDRKKQIDGLLGIDRFEKVRSELVKTVNRLKDMKTDRESFVKAGDINKTKDELLKNRDERNQIEKDMQAISRELGEISSRRKDLESKLSELESTRRIFENLSEKKTGLSHTISSSCERFKCRPEDLDNERLSEQKEKEKKEMDERKEELSKLKISIREIQEIIASDKSKLNQLEEKKKRRTELGGELSKLLGGKKLSDIEKELNYNADELNKKNEELMALRAKANEILEANKELERGKGKCPVCETSLSDDRKKELVSSRNSWLKQTGNKIKEMENNSEKKSLELRKSQKTLLYASSLEAKISEITIPWKKEDLDSSLLSNTEKKNKLESQLQEKEKEISSCESSLRGLEEKLKLLSLVDELSLTEKKLSGTSFNKKEYEQLRTGIEKERVDESGKSAKLEGLERENSRIGEAIKIQSEKLADLEKHSRTIMKIDSSLESFSVFQNCVIDTQKDLRELLISSINSAMTEIWSSVYPYGDYNELRLKSDDKGYDLEAKVGGEWVSVDGIASGGERATACLALRIAFSIVLAPNLNWLILDEPTHNLDGEAVRYLSNTLYNKIPEIVDQTFVITHDENLRDAASGRLYMITRNKKENGPSIVEKLE